MKLPVKLLLIAIAFSLASCKETLSLYEASLSDPKLSKSKKEMPKSNQVIGIQQDTDISENYDIDKDFSLSTLSPGQRPDISSDEAGIWMVMDRAELKLKTSGNLIRDPALTKYVRDLVCKLAGSYCPDIRTYVMRVPAFNASMAPNGVMQVWTGLLLRVRNESQLATVLGHEIGHYLRRHSLQRMRDTVSKSNALIFFQLATAAAGLPGAADLAALAVHGSIAAFSRDNEREADGYGIRFLVENGYNPHEAPKVWDQVKRELKPLEEDGVSRSVFYASHPPVEERSNSLKKLAVKMMKTRPPGKTGRKSFLNAIQPHRSSFLRDEINLRQFKKMQALLQILFEDGFNKGQLHYFQGELYRIRDEEGDKKKAFDSYMEAVKTSNSPPETHREIGLLHYKAKKKEKAREHFYKYIQLNPTAVDKEMILHMIGEGA